MASSIIHLAISSELNKKLKRNPSKFFIGTIAPDISKLIGENRFYSHFLDDPENNIPNVDKFLVKYKNHLDDDFVFGYYIHLLVDYFWFKYFMGELVDEDFIVTKLDGTKVKCTREMLKRYIYNDYTNLNTDLIDQYNLDLKIFYNELPEFDNIITEIPMDKIDLIVDKTGEIIENSKVRKDLIFNIDNINKFIKTSIELIEGELEKHAN